jgi:hypothetical protein
MAYFRCSHGTMYHPFGNISTAHLQREIRRTGMFSADERDVPIVSFPLAEIMSQLGSSTSTSATAAATATGGGGTQLSRTGVQSDGIPLVEREPCSEATQLFGNLADETLEQIFLQQLTAQMVSTFEIYCLRSYQLHR